MIARAMLGVTLATCVAAPAAAESDLFSGDQLRGFFEVRAGVSDADERSWFDEGFGKTRYGEDGDTIIGRGVLEWRPHLTWSLDGYVTLQADLQIEPAVGLVEAYLSWRGSPSAGWRYAARAGLMYPPVSLEHEGVGWTTEDTITPSAINSWIGEEVKVVGLEGTARRRFGNQEFAVTAALFGYNDTAGTLLAFRGWAMHDAMPILQSRQQLPARSFIYQESTMATYELDDRVGYYARIEYMPVGSVTIDVMHYDNAGDRISDYDGQTDWETRFTNLGVRAALGPNTRLRAQAMVGQTIWGMSTPGLGYWTDVDFSSAYLMLAHDRGENTFAGRLDYFEVTDMSYVAVDNNDEEGWAATAAWRRALSDDMSLAVEALHIASDRPTRLDTGVEHEQTQTVLQSALRYGF